MWIICPQTVKKLATIIDKLKAELSTSASSNQPATATSKIGSPATGLAVIRPTKLVRSQSSVASEVIPSVTSSTGDGANADDKHIDVSPSLDQVVIRAAASTRNMGTRVLDIFKM